MDREKCEYLNVVVPNRRVWWNQFDGNDLDEEIKTKIIKKKKTLFGCLENNRKIERFSNWLIAMTANSYERESERERARYRERESERELEW